LKLLILGSNGLVGSSLSRILIQNNLYTKIVPSTRRDADLFSFSETKNLIEREKPDVVINAAAKVGGIVANDTNRSEFILENLKININLLESLIPFPDTKLINLGSSCIYPLGAKMPIKESSLMTGPLEPTNSPYAMAKLTAIEIGEALRIQHGHKITNIMPTNLYGPFDNFSETSSHVIPGLIARLVKTKNLGETTFKVWGTGKPKREFLHVDDLSYAIDFLLTNNFDESIINVGGLEEISIYDLVYKLKKTIGFDGEILFDVNMPDGNPRKLLDSSKINNLGWKPKITLDEGLESTYKWYLANKNL
jgi:GDP-L-fucose synthase